MLIGIKDKINFFRDFLLNDYKDIFRLLKLFLSYNKRYEKQD